MMKMKGRALSEKTQCNNYEVRIMGRIYGRIAVIFPAVFLIVAARADAQLNVDLSTGIAIKSGIRGQCPVAGPSGGSPRREKTLEVSYDTLMRGVAGGLEADVYNWKNLTAPGAGPYLTTVPTTFGYLSEASERNSQPLVTVNTRGIGSCSTWGDFTYTDTSTATLTQLAADWVRYTNVIAQNYRQGDTITGRDADILNQLDWGGMPKLAEQGAALPSKVTYWEIGNEPKANDSLYYYLSPSEYASRYKQITSAMLAEDPTIKVGPCLNTGGDLQLVSVISDSSNQVDFVSYHPYDFVGWSDFSTYARDITPAGLESDLRGVKDVQVAARQQVITTLSNYGRPVNTPLIASEWNPSSWHNTGVTNSMTQALGVAETVFSFAEMGMFGATYWIFPGDGNPVSYEAPAFKMFDALQEHMGDTLVQSWYGGATNAADSSTRLYITKDSQTNKVVLWGLNFSDTTDQTVQINLDDLGYITDKGSLMKLQWMPGYGTTSLTNPFGDDYNYDDVYIDWDTTQLTGLDTSNLSFTLEHSKVTALVLTEPEPEPVEVTLSLVDNGCPENGLHSYTLVATGPGVQTLGQFTIDGEVHQVFHSGSHSEWLGDSSALESDETDSYVIFGDIRLPDLGGEDWDYDAYPDGPPDKFTVETIDAGGDSGLGTLNNYDAGLDARDAYMKLGLLSGDVETVELMQLVVADGCGFSIDLTLLTATDYDEDTHDSILTTHDLSFLLASLRPGDADGDGYVDADDAAILAQHWLQTDADWADGDFNRDGVVNDMDACIMASNWQPQSANVPEPGVWVLLIAIAATMTLQRKYYYWVKVALHQIGVLRTKVF